MASPMSFSSQLIKTVHFAVFIFLDSQESYYCPLET